MLLVGSECATHVLAANQTPARLSGNRAAEQASAPSPDQAASVSSASPHEWPAPCPWPISLATWRNLTVANSRPGQINRHPHEWTASKLARGSDSTTTTAVSLNWPLPLAVCLHNFRRRRRCQWWALNKRRQRKPSHDWTSDGPAMQTNSLASSAIGEEVALALGGEWGAVVPSVGTPASKRASE